MTKTHISKQLSLSDCQNGVIERLTDESLALHTIYIIHMNQSNTTEYRYREDTASGRRGQRAEEGRREAAGPRRAEDG